MSEFQTVLVEQNEGIRERLKEEFLDPEYRYAYAEDFLNTSVAIQIKVLREHRDMTQEELADKIGTKQAGVSRLENVNYSAWKTETLRNIAKALGVRLKITFETFGTLLDEAAQFSREALSRPDFEHDPAFQNVQPAERENKSEKAEVELPLPAGALLEAQGQIQTLGTESKSEVEHPNLGSATQELQTQGQGLKVRTVGRAA
jgi:transcriptional regulator with XRE-family HTH domain